MNTTEEHYILRSKVKETIEQQFKCNLPRICELSKRFKKSPKTMICLACINRTRVLKALGFNRVK